jgi:hypothetical protein
VGNGLLVIKEVLRPVSRESGPNLEIDDRFPIELLAGGAYPLLVEKLSVGLLIKLLRLKLSEDAGAIVRSEEVKETGMYNCRWGVVFPIVPFSEPVAVILKRLGVAEAAGVRPRTTRKATSTTPRKL